MVFHIIMREGLGHFNVPILRQLGRCARSTVNCHECVQLIIEFSSTLRWRHGCAVMAGTGPPPPPSTTCRTEFLAMATRRPCSKNKGKVRTNSHHGRLSFALCLTKSIQKWWFLDSAEQRGSWRAGTSRRPIIKLDGNGLTVNVI